MTPRGGITSGGTRSLPSTSGGTRSLPSTDEGKRFLTSSTMSRGERFLTSHTTSRRERSLTSYTTNRGKRFLTSSTMSRGERFLTSHTTSRGERSLISCTTSWGARFMTSSITCRGERFSTSSITCRRERVSSSISRRTRVLPSTSGGKKYLTLKLRLYLSSTSNIRGIISHEGMATTEKHMTRLHQQENVMNLKQQSTKTWEQKTRSKFNLQQINLSLNLMTMEQNESLTTQPIMSRGSKTW